MLVVRFGTPTNQDQVVLAVIQELSDAQELFTPMKSYHEGYAVILEELDELWDEAKKKLPDQDKLYTEAKQVAAMAIRFMLDLCPEK